MICATIVLGLSTLAYASNAFVILVGFSLVNVAAFLAYDERPSFWWLVAALVVQCAIVARVRGRSFARAVPWLAESANATAIEAPFAGLWMVAAGGPFAAGNHHLRARDQRFAYDFIRLGKSLGAPILAPCAGIVARVKTANAICPRREIPTADTSRVASSEITSRSKPPLDTCSSATYVPARSRLGWAIGSRPTTRSARAATAAERRYRISTFTRKTAQTTPSTMRSASRSDFVRLAGGRASCKSGASCAVEKR